MVEIVAVGLALFAITVGFLIIIKFLDRQEERKRNQK